jgi:serine/threonine protein phosphatase 1
MNKLGRDFVIGDIHGAYDTVKRGMRAVNFDPKKDRLFCVGDLIDRGPGSHRCVDFLKLPCVYACRGNHDDDFVDMDVSSLKIIGATNFHGLGWVVGHDDATLEAVRRALLSLPVVIEIETPRGLVGLVHADVPRGMSWQEFVERVECGDERVLSIALGTVDATRRRVECNDASGVPGIGRVFVGHTVSWDGPTALGNVFAIDTGACFQEIPASTPVEMRRHQKSSLTMLNLQFGTQSLAGVAAEKGLRVLDDCISGPFGSSITGPAPARERQRA